MKPEIKILAVKTEAYVVPTWDEFKHVIRGAVSDWDEGTVDHAIATLEKTVKYGIRLAPEARRSLNAFRKIMEGGMATFKLRMHCEAVFAALLEARDRAQSKPSADTDTTSETLANFFKVLGLMCLM